MATNNLPPIFRFDWSDYTSLGATFQKFIANLNLFTLGVYNLLNGGIGFQNLQRSIYKMTLTPATNTYPLLISNPLPVVPSGVVVVKATLNGNTNVALTTAVSVANWGWDGRYINIYTITGLTNGSTYSISLEIF